MWILFNSKDYSAVPVLNLLESAESRKAATRGCL